MEVMEEVLKPYGLKLEDLNPLEQETAFNWLKSENIKDITIGKLKIYFRELISAVEKELANTPEVEYYFLGLLSRPSRKQVQLKARLLNYLILESFITSPDKARMAIAESLSRISKKV